jgi:hypothetical protein
MPSKTQDNRENQKKLYDQLIQARSANLEKKGIPPKEFNKDKVYEHLRAKRRAIMKAMVIIDASKARNEQSKEAVAEPATPVPTAPKEKKPKKEKAEKAAPAKAVD